MKKKKYEPAELEIVRFNVYDVITTSLPGGYPDDGEDEEGNGGIGGGYNPDGWT